MIIFSQFYVCIFSGFLWLGICVPIPLFSGVRYETNGTLRTDEKVCWENAFCPCPKSICSWQIDCTIRKMLERGAVISLRFRGRADANENSSFVGACSYAGNESGV